MLQKSLALEEKNRGNRRGVNDLERLWRHDIPPASAHWSLSWSWTGLCSYLCVFMYIHIFGFKKTTEPRPMFGAISCGRYMPASLFGDTSVSAVAIASRTRRSRFSSRPESPDRHITLLLHYYGHACELCVKAENYDAWSTGITIRWGPPQFW